MADGFDFSPLSVRERETAAHDLAHEGEQDPRPGPPPANAAASDDAAARLFGRAPDALWRYHDAAGVLVFCVCRWNQSDGEKDIRPLSWFDGEGWRLAAWPDARPLYNLDKLSASPNAPVVVCEGEKAADAAARVFSKSVARTSSGGANAAGKTDWTPLSGRRVLGWPDNDDPGRKYAGDVAAILCALDCEVSIIEPAALFARIAREAAAELSDAEKRTNGFDAADAVADWPDVAALRKAAVELAKPFHPGPAYRSFGAYTMDARGLTLEVEKRRGGNKTTVPVRIAAPFEILGACRDPHGAGWGKVLRWRDDDGREHVRHVADADLHGEPAMLCAGLANRGLRIDRTRQRDFVGYLSGVSAPRRVTVVSRTGWQEIGGRSVFVLPAETIGRHNGERVILDAAAHGSYEARGSIEEWRDGPAKLASGHILPVLAISAALKGPLLHLAGVEGGGVHFYGQSSQGKTTLLQMAASVWGKGATPGYVRTWRATANGLEGAAATATDTVLILDELGQVDGRELAGALYALANGAGKQRAMRDGSLREPRSWRVLTISSGGVPIDAKLTEDRGRKTRAGQLIRMLDIPTARVCGVFDRAGPNGDAADLAKRCKLAAASAYGIAGPEFVRMLLANDVGGGEVRTMVNEFLAAEVPPGSDGQIDRAAQRLAIVAVAGELATVFGLTGWGKGEAREAASWALCQWIDARGGTEPAELRQSIEQVRLAIESHGESRFQSMDDPDAKPVNHRLGWRKGAGVDREWWVLPECWKAEVCAGLDPQFVARTLAERGMLRRQGETSCNAQSTSAAISESGSTC
jgi:uncharacterized protein (DUF927 family)